MDKIDLIIDAIAYARACIGRQLTSKNKLNQNINNLHNALEAARELKDELYAKEMEQPTPKQSGNMSFTVLRQALAQPEQKPVAYLCENAVGYKYFRKKKPENVYKPIALYAAPVKRPWQGLTSEDWENTPDTGKQGCERDAEMFDWVEQTLKDKNDVI